MIICCNSIHTRPFCSVLEVPGQQYDSISIHQLVLLGDMCICCIWYGFSSNTFRCYIFIFNSTAVTLCDYFFYLSKYATKPYHTNAFRIVMIDRNGQHIVDDVFNVFSRTTISYFNGVLFLYDIWWNSIHHQHNLDRFDIGHGSQEDVLSHIKDTSKMETKYISTIYWCLSRIISDVTSSDSYFEEYPPLETYLCCQLTIYWHWHIFHNLCRVKLAAVRRYSFDCFKLGITWITSLTIIYILGEMLIFILDFCKYDVLRIQVHWI